MWFVLLLILMISADVILTRTYCRIQQMKDAKYGELTCQKPQYTKEQIAAYSFPKKQIKQLFHLYKGWIRYKLHLLGI